jgi:hypothetical protein
MRTLPLAIATTGALLASTATAHATPPKPGPTVQGCGMLVTTDPTPDATLGGPTTHQGVIYGGPIVIADTDDLFANAVDGTLTCWLYIDGVDQQYQLATSGSQSYVVAIAALSGYDADPAAAVSVCSTLDLTNAHGEQATFDLGCRPVGVVPVPGPLCLVTQFVPQPVRPIVDGALGC